MHIPLVIAILAFLALALLPVLDRSAGSEINAKGLRVLLDSCRTLDEGVSQAKARLSLDLHFRRGYDNIQLIHRNPWFGTDQV